MVAMPSYRKVQCPNMVFSIQHVAAAPCKFRFLSQVKTSFESSICENEHSHVLAVSPRA